MKKLSIIFIAGLFTLALYLNPVSAEAEVSSGTVPEAEMTVPAVTTAAPAKEKSDVNLTYVNLEEKERWILDEVLSDYVSEDVVELTDRGIRYSIGDWIDRDTHCLLYTSISISKPGSTKGKKPERILTGTSVPNTLLKILLIMTLPEVKVISLSTISASYWKNALS